MNQRDRYYAELTNREKIVHLDRLIQIRRNLDDLSSFHRSQRTDLFALLFPIIGVMMLYSFYVFLSTGAFSFSFRTDHLFTMLTLGTTAAIATSLRYYASFADTSKSSKDEAQRDQEQLKIELGYGLNRRNQRND